MTQKAVFYDITNDELEQSAEFEQIHVTPFAVVGITGQERKHIAGVVVTTKGQLMWMLLSGKTYPQFSVHQVS